MRILRPHVCHSLLRHLSTRACWHHTSSIITTEEGFIDLSPFINDFELVLDHPKFLIINKSACVGIQDDSKTVKSEHWRKGIATTLSELNPQIRSVHRLDKNVTGGVVFGKDAQTTTMISKNLRLGGNSGYKFTRRYVGLISSGKIVLPKSPKLGDTEDYGAGTIALQDNGSFEETKFIMSSSDSGIYQAVVIELSTGRKHQIRRHLSQILKRPLLNDKRYGGDILNEDEVSIALHSAYISLKVGMKEISTMIPVKYSHDLWKGFTNDEGIFNEDIRDLLSNFDQRFKERTNIC